MIRDWYNPHRWPPDAQVVEKFGGALLKLELGRLLSDKEDRDFCWVFDAIRFDATGAVSVRMPFGNAIPLDRCQSVKRF